MFSKFSRYGARQRRRLFYSRHCLIILQDSGCLIARLRPARDEHCRVMQTTPCERLCTAPSGVEETARRCVASQSCNIFTKKLRHPARSAVIKMLRDRTGCFCENQVRTPPYFSRRKPQLLRAQDPSTPDTKYVG
jgi:hypothetical protein